MGIPYQKTFSLSLIAAVANGIAQSQSGTAATPLTLNGSLVSGGVATFDKPRRVIITSAGDDSAHTFTLLGTDYYGRSQTEIMTGANGVAQSTKDYASITRITPNSNTTSTVTAGTNTVGSTIPMVPDAFINPANYAIAVVVSGTVNYSIEVSYDDFGPAYDINTTSPTWFSAAGFSSQAANASGTIQGPFTFIRLTINSGTGTATATVITPLKAGGF